jgi:hypothetical protein
LITCWLECWSNHMFWRYLLHCNLPHQKRTSVVTILNLTFEVT